MLANRWSSKIHTLQHLLLASLYPAIAFVPLSSAAFLSFSSASDAGLHHKQNIIVVSVGREGNELALKFSPEEVVAEVGDMVQFQFYPLNHSAVQAEFDSPCVPIKNSSSGGFFSGFRPLPLQTKIITTFTIPVKHPDPIFFYCSQGRHCQQGFVGVINPTPEKSLQQFKAIAALAPDNLSPGEKPSFNIGASPISPAPTLSRLLFPGTERPSVLNVGAIVGAILGGVVVTLIIVVFGVFIFFRRRSRGLVLRRSVQGYTISRPAPVRINSDAMRSMGGMI